MQCNKGKRRINNFIYLRKNVNLIFFMFMRKVNFGEKYYNFNGVSNVYYVYF